MFRRSFAAALLLWHATFSAYAEIAFEVASIKVNTGGGEVNNRSAQEKVRLVSGQLSMSNVTLITCIMSAYRIHRFQVSFPAWMNSARYDINAKAGTDAPPEQLRLMLRTLLRERFHLNFHREQKTLGVYLLTQGKGEHKLRPAEQTGDKRMEMSGGAIGFRNYSVAELIETLSNAPFRVDRPVLDMTDLAGRYDFEVTIGADELAMKHAFEGVLRGDGEGPSLLDLVAQQLGLRFTPARRLLEVLTVDSADRTPSAN
jgi:uncharacterized protein (TIGR03435 family)